MNKSWNNHIHFNNTWNPTVSEPISDNHYIINLRQLRRMSILETGTIGCLFITLWSGKENGLLTILLSIISSLIYGAVLIAIGRCDGGYYALTERTFPSLMWRGIWCLYSLRYAIHSAWILSYLVNLIQGTLYDQADWLIMLPLLIVCIYAGRRSIAERARFAELLFWWVILPLAGIFLFGIWKTDLSISMHLTTIQVPELLRDEYRLMVLFLPVELLLFRMSALSGSDKRIWRHSLLTILLSGLWMLLVYIVTIGILGNIWGHSNLLGVTDAMEQIIHWNGAFERMDILILLFWLIGSIYSFSAYLFQGQQLLQRAFAIHGVSSSYTGSWWAVLLETGLTLAIYYLFPTADTWTDWYLRFACYIDFPLSIGIPALIWCIYTIKNHRTPPAMNHRIQLKGKAAKEFSWFLPLMVCLLICPTLAGCSQSDSIEDRAYVKELHITDNGDQYEFRCVLSYLSQDSLDALHTSSYLTEDTVPAPMSEESQDSQISSKGDSTDSPDSSNSETFEFSEEQDIYEYHALARDISEFNDAFKNKTDCTFDYSHLHGIYLDHQLYDPVTSGQLIADIRSYTKAVLSTPIYEENILIGNQQEVTLGDRLQYQKEHNPD